VKMVLFDLGGTLEQDDVLLPGARETLAAIDALRDGDGRPVALGLVSDFDMPVTPEDLPAIQQGYYAILDQLGIRSFFEPVARWVTLSSEVGVVKPDESVFRAAVAKADPDLGFSDVLFVTENRAHVLAARRLGLAAVHVRGPGQPDGEVDALPDLLPIVRDLVSTGEEQWETQVLSVASGAGRPAATVGVTSARLGDVLVVSGLPSEVRRFVSGSDLAAPPVGCAVPTHRLHLVTQIGRCFQEDHPDVPVVVDKGRYLVVDLDPATVAAPGPSATGCYAVRPLPDGVVFEQRTPGTTRREAPRTELPGASGTPSEAEFEADLGALVGIRSRHSTGAGFLEALDWAQRELTALGYATRVDTVALGAGTTRNLVADRPGGGDTREVVIVTAHLDSVNLRGGPSAAAPGADDNASGSAGVLAVARRFAGHTGTHDLRLVLFGGEEQGLFGSLAYVAALDPAERARVRAVVNMDMIAGRNTDSPTVLLEGAAVSQGVIDALSAMAQAHTSLAVQTSLHPFNSDHVPFLDRGIPAVLTIEGADGANDRVHTDRDRIEFVDSSLAVQILRMNVAFVAQALDGH
jgi:hypothetical protein